MTSIFNRPASPSVYLANQCRYFNRDAARRHANDAAIYSRAMMNRVDRMNNGEDCPVPDPPEPPPILTPANFDATLPLQVAWAVRNEHYNPWAAYEKEQPE